MKRPLLLMLCVLLFPSCNRIGNNHSPEETLASVNDRVLTREEIELLIPKGLSPDDSLIHAESLVKKRIIELLIDDVAYQNLGDEKAEIDRLVNEYRRLLIRHHYQVRMVSDRVSANIRESDLISYYEENKEQFVLNENLIKGLFLKVPISAPGLDNIRSWYRSRSEESLEKIEKYSLQNALIYVFFYDNWMTYNEIMEKIPHRINNPTQFLRVNDHLEVSDSAFMYLLNITECLPVGSAAPFNYVQSKILSVLVNKQKIDYLREFGEQLYYDAIKNGKVKFISE